MKAPKINNDKYSDILWQNKNTGEVEYWLLRSENSASEIIGSSSQGIVGPGWNVVNHGDYNYDGIDDILWVNENSGQVVWWDLAGGGQNIVHELNNIGPEWKAIPFYGSNATGDTGLSPLLWFNTSTGQVVQWRMQNGAISGITEVGRADPNAGWEALGSKDGNIYWHNHQTGETGYWSTFAGVQWNRTENRGGDWKFLGLGKFVNDEVKYVNGVRQGYNRPAGTLWENLITGEVSASYDETVVVQPTWFQTFVHTEHKIQTIGYAGQGWDATIGQFTSETAGQIPGVAQGRITDSILWHNQSTGESLVWDVANGPGAFHTLNGVSSEWSII
ncbi:hypothetical protein [Methylobacterium nonmethylotrophicum]|uniref:VCBS repeat-containing protein n=1 Tax=Methylobacterium nonmethylotrophicum TaxID=1141884 RepID=A0A4Z0NYW1_9HYPH|nr:hypothetical protein [Methylobacterium nonmethylotrophicum]TGE02232.1 hypothetical protein EU555_00140 [Methylobacterium nonmethylotrophicum]